MRSVVFLLGMGFHVDADFEGVFPSWCQTGAEQDLVPPLSQPVGKIIVN